MIELCLLILAWVVTMPLWASITITVVASLRLIIQLIYIIVKVIQETYDKVLDKYDEM